MTHKWSKTRIPRSDLTRLDYYLPYSSKIQVFDSIPSQILGHYLAYYSTLNNGRILNIFRIAWRDRVICRSLIPIDRLITLFVFCSIFAAAAVLPMIVSYQRRCLKLDKDCQWRQGQLRQLRQR